MKVAKLRIRVLCSDTPLLETEYKNVYCSGTVELSWIQVLGETLVITVEQPYKVKENEKEVIIGGS